MNLVILTEHYPYKPGEEFIDNEVKELSKYFHKITIISAEKNISKKKLTKMPLNIEYVVVNKNYKKIRVYLSAFIELFSMKTIREIIFAKKNLDYSFNFKMLKSIFIYYALSKGKLLWIKENLLGKEANHVFYSYWLTNGAYTLAKLKKNGLINYAISRAHGGDAFLDRGFLPFRREIYKYLDEIHFVSEQAKINFENRIMLGRSETKAKLFVSRLGIEKKDNLINLREKKENGVFQVISCSNIIQLKRLDLIVDALSLIDDHRIKWTHIGQGSKKDQIFELINEKLNNCNIEVEFLGYLDNEKVLDLYRNHGVDLFINVSDYEGVPVSIMEAFSYGIPSLARDVGGNREIVINNHNGFLLEKEANPKIIADTIRRVLEMSEQQVNLLRKNAYNTWKEKYNSNINYTIFVKNMLESSLEKDKRW
jgi:glycosyltransferase involved in cell wall biosynthesis